jgi:hypothetical protein
MNMPTNAHSLKARPPAGQELLTTAKPPRQTEFPAAKKIKT